MSLDIASVAKQDQQLAQPPTSELDSDTGTSTYLSSLEDRHLIHAYSQVGSGERSASRIALLRASRSGFYSIHALRRDMSITTHAEVISSFEKYARI
jgi:hypothetical protein